MCPPVPGAYARPIATMINSLNLLSCNNIRHIVVAGTLSLKELGISAVRGGSIVGEHEVLFCGQDEVIEFKHTAYSKAVFAKGAVEAAKFLKGKGAGHYDMADVIAAK